MIKNGSIYFLVTTLACLQSNKHPSRLFRCRAIIQSPDGGSRLRWSERFPLTPPKPNRDCAVRGNTLVQIYVEHIVWLNNRYYPCEFRQYHLSSTSTSSTEQGIVIVFTNQLQCISHPIVHRIYVALEWHTENYLLDRAFVSGTVGALQIHY